MSNKKDTTLAISDYNLEKIHARNYEEILSSAFEVGTNVACFGRRGLGKTEIQKSMIKKADLREVYANISTFERVDLGGFPEVFTPAEKRRKFVEYMLPILYEPMIEGNQKCVLVLDEVDKADASLCAPLLEITQFKTINGRPLPNLLCSTMTGNLISEGGFRPSLPLLDRCEKYLLEVDVESWMKWAADSQQIHTSVLAFIHDNPHQLSGKVDDGENYSSASPRGWHFASKVLFHGEEKKWNSDLLLRKVAGFIGKQVGIDYNNYFKYYHNVLPLVDEVFAGKDVHASRTYRDLKKSEKLVLAMLTCGRMATKMNEFNEKREKPEIKTALKNVGKFLGKNDQEDVLVSVRQNIKAQTLVNWGLEKNPDWSFVPEITKTVIG